MASGWLLHLMQGQWERLFGEREAASCKLLAASWFSQERWYKVNYVVVEQNFILIIYLSHFIFQDNIRPLRGRVIHDVQLQQILNR